MLLGLQVGVFAVLQLHQNSAQAYQNVDFLAPFLPFRDASCGPSTFHLTVLHCIQVQSSPAAITKKPVCLCLPHALGVRRGRGGLWFRVYWV